MNCPTCKRRMCELFLSTRCDWCDFGPNVWHMHRGFVVYAELDCTLPECARVPTAHYVFRSIADGMRWKDVASRPGDIRAVLSTRAFHWVERTPLGYGSILVVAGQTYLVHPDHRYPDAVGEVFLAPKREGE